MEHRNHKAFLISSGVLQDKLAAVIVRTYDPKDQQAVRLLYTQGLLAGQIPPHDTGADIENIQEAYLKTPSNHFWVAELESQVIGMIAVIAQGEHCVEIKRLRVQKDWQNTGIAARLVETAVEHCRHYGNLKVVFDTRFDPDNDPSPVVKLLDRQGFQYARTKNVHGKDLLEFYLDLYRQPSPPTEEG